MKTFFRLKASGKARKRGVVLVSVLWTIVLLSALAMAASVSFRGFAGVLAIDRDRAQMEGVLSAGLEAGADLLIKTEGQASPLNSELILPTGVVRIHISDEQGRIDINKVPIEVFVSLFEQIGAPDAKRLAQAVIAWRVQAKGGQVFDDVRQLAQIPDIEARYIDRLRPLTTVFGSGTVNPLTASEDVLRALPQMTENRVERLIELRRSSPVNEAQMNQALGPAAPYLKASNNVVARLELTAALSDTYAAAATAVIAVSPDGKQPYRVLAWTPAPLFAAR